MQVPCPRCGAPGCLRPYVKRSPRLYRYYRVIHYLGRGRRLYHHVPLRRGLVLIASGQTWTGRPPRHLKKSHNPHREASPRSPRTPSPP